MKLPVLLAVLLLLAPVVIAQETAVCCCTADNTGYQSLSFLPESQCDAAHPSHVAPTALGQDCAAVCNAAPTTTPSCNNNAPAVQNVIGRGVKAKAIMRVSWAPGQDSTGANCAPLSVTVERCSKDVTKCVTLGDTSNTFFEDDGTIGNTASSTVQTLQWKLDMKYRITAHYASTNAQPAVGPAYLGDLECFGISTSNSFCLATSHLGNSYIKSYLQGNGYPSALNPGRYLDKTRFGAQTYSGAIQEAFADVLNAAIHCDAFNKNTIDKKCPADKTCYKKTPVPGQPDTQAQCIVPDDTCDFSDQSAFGLGVTQPVCEGNPPSTPPTYCFFDRGPSAQDICYKCDPTMTCYDYKQQDTCARNACGVGACEWKPVVGLEDLGVGVCRDRQISNCGLCGTTGSNPEAFNGVFLQCTKEVANALSTPENQCFFVNGGGDDSTASDCAGADCTVFDSSQCANPLDVITLGKKNELTVSSKDSNICHIPVCQLVEAEASSSAPAATCRKNADGKTNTITGTLSDCAADDIDCEKDYFPPQTVMGSQTVKGITKFLLAKISDQTSSDEVASPIQSSNIDITSTSLPCDRGERLANGYTLWFCAKPVNDTSGKCDDARDESQWDFSVRNLLCFADGNVSDADGQITNLPEGKYEFRYFTEDEHHNIETVKSVPLIVCNGCLGPTLKSVTLSPGRQFGDTYYTSGGSTKPGALPITIAITFTDKASLSNTIITPTGSSAQVAYSASPDPSTGATTLFTLTPQAGLADSNYTLSFNAVNLKGVSMVAPVTFKFVVDTKAPTLLVDPRNDILLNVTNVPINVSADEPVNVTTLNISERVLFGSDPGVFIVLDTVLPHGATTFAKIWRYVTALDSGRKTVIAGAEDLAANIGSATGSFSVIFGPPVIGIQKPRFGVSSAFTFDIVAETSEPSACRYSDLATGPSAPFNSLLKMVDSADGYTHTLKNYNEDKSKLPVDGSTKQFFIACKDADNLIGTKKFTLRIDLTPPFLVKTGANPNPIIQTPLTTTLQVQGNEKIFCKYREIDNVSIMTTPDKEAFYATFNNEFPGFNLSPSTSKDVQVKVNDSVLQRPSRTQLYAIACFNEAQLGPVFGSIAVTVDLNQTLSITSTTPPGFNATTVDVTVATNKPATCVGGDEQLGFTTGDGIAHALHLTGLDPGVHTLAVTCSATLEAAGEQSVQEATKDVTFAVDLSPPYMVRVNDDSALADKEQSFQLDRLQADWLGDDDETAVTAYFYTLKEQGAGGATIIDCSDPAKVGPGCNILPASSNPFMILKTQNGTPLPLINGNRYFFSVKPRNQVGWVGAFNDSDGVLINTSAEPTHCSNVVKDGKETDVDCGGDCKACDLNQTCSIDVDCLSQSCKIIDGRPRCVPSLCTDGVRNGDESDIDCGGSCQTKCIEGKQCIINGDCASGNCFNNVCVASNPCTNGVHDGTESDIDCGGACPVKCGEGQQCLVDSDCQTGFACGNNLCRICQAGDVSCGLDNDRDGDGVPNDLDKCPGTAKGAAVDEFGCSVEQRFSCGDSIPDSWRCFNEFSEKQCNVAADIHCTGDAAANADPDGDGLTNEEEYQLGTNPHNPDTDGDDWSDREERDAGTDPLDPNDHPLSWLWIWLMIIILLSLLVGGYFGYKEYRKKHPLKPGQKPGLGPNLMQRLQEARARLAARTARAKVQPKPQTKEGKTDEFVEVGGKQESEAFKKLKAMEARAAHEKGSELPQSKPQAKPIFTGALGKLEQAVRPSLPQGQEQNAIESLSKVAFSNMSAKDRADIMKKLRLLKLGKLSTQEIEELLKKLRLTADYYKRHKDHFAVELEAFVDNKSITEAKLRQLSKRKEAKK